MNPAQRISRSHFHHGQLLREQQRYEEALAEMGAAIEADRDFAEAYVESGFLLERLGRLSDAVVAYERAIGLRHDLVEAHFNLGAACVKIGWFETAAAAFRRAITLRPNYAEGYLGLGTALRLKNDLDGAVAACRSAISARPDFVDAWINLANIHRAQNRLPEAREACRRALELAPDSPAAHINLAMVHLVAGELRAGWPHAEFRHALKLGGAGRSFPVPRWTGQEKISGVRILLHAEQGYGDTVLFARFIPRVIALGAIVFLEVQKPLVALLRASFPDLAGIVATGEDLPPFEMHCPLPSLPLALNVDLADVVSNGSYLTVPPDRRERWQGRIGHDDELRVGLAWLGNPTHPNDYNRSIPLSLLAPLCHGREGVHFYALKPEMSAADAAVLAAMPHVANLGPQLTDFADSAAVIAQLDLIIAVDTSVAHLAGALGRPVWLLLPFSPDWRWLLDRDDSPWYPTARLIRQPKTGDWVSVVSHVAIQLTSLAKETKTVKRGRLGGPPLP